MNLKLEYRKANVTDIDILTKTRVQVLRIANKLSNDIDMSEVEKESYSYYKKCFSDYSHVAYLVFDEDMLIGAGGISFYNVMPTYHNPSGRKAYIMNMYTQPDYRRKGIAYKTLHLLILEAKSNGISSISLEATDMGRPLYTKYGFITRKDEMELPK